MGSWKPAISRLCKLLCNCSEKTTVLRSLLKLLPFTEPEALHDESSSYPPRPYAVPILAILEDPGECEAVVLETMATLPPS